MSSAVAILAASTTLHAKMVDRSMLKPFKLLTINAATAAVAVAGSSVSCTSCF